MDFNLAQLHETIAEAIPERECIVTGARRLSWADVNERTRRLANYLASRGLGAHRERDALEGWESGQDHLALYLHNGNEYLEGMLGAYKARVAPFNVNYRYVEEELVYLLRDARARAIIYHSAFAPRLRNILPELPDLKVLIQVDDGSGAEVLSEAVGYEQALESASPERPELEWSPDDLYILYTGGTTGMPKGVLWRQADIFVAALGGRRWDGSELSSLDDVVERACAGGMRVLPSPPFMHGAAHWAAFMNFHSGHVVVVQREAERFDPEDVLSTVESENVDALLIVGDAFGRPLIDQISRRAHDLSSLRVIVTGGAALSASLKQELLRLLPQIRIVDAIGSSESGNQGQQVSSNEDGVATGTFVPSPGTKVLSADLERVLEAGDLEIGWFARGGRVPLGYLGDREKSEQTFPTVQGERYSVPGDRARQLQDGLIEVYGRESQTINSGGEKVFAEEVENALKYHSAVYDAIVVGRPSERWGQEVVALVRLVDGSSVVESDLIAECAKHIARYKLPKAVMFLDELVRSPSGKADYRWAKAQVS